MLSRRGATSSGTTLRIPRLNTKHFRCWAVLFCSASVTVLWQAPSGFCLYGYLTALMVLAWHKLPEHAQHPDSHTGTSETSESEALKHASLSERSETLCDMSTPLGTF